MSIIANCGVLAVFKYCNFFIDNMNALLHGLHLSTHPLPFLAIILPIGLSFHTFQAMSYTIEVYRGKYRAERHFGIYSLYVMFYPQLVAGPIERPQNLLHQFRERHAFDYDRMIMGLEMMFWGFVKKMVIADRLAIFVNDVYKNPYEQNGITLFIATLFFAFQIYCDFSGYSEIAIGSAKVMGFDLMTNFKMPYMSKNIREFWSRWHISLSTWFRDYLYIPLGGNKVNTRRMYLNIVIVFLVSGLWHGANWTFVIWGALHALYTIVYLITRRSTVNHSFMSNFVGCVNTFIAVTVAWIFFRASNLHEAIFTIRKIFSLLPEWKMVPLYIKETQKIAPFNQVLGFILIILLVIIEWIKENKTAWQRIRLPYYFKPLLYVFLIILFMQVAVFDYWIQFIYFQF